MKTLNTCATIGCHNHGRHDVKLRATFTVSKPRRLYFLCEGCYLLLDLMIKDAAKAGIRL